MMFLTSCATQSFTINPGAGKEAVNTGQAFFLSGIGQTQHINAADVCGGAQNVVRVEAQQTFLNWFLGGLTFGIYTPRQARVYCK